MKTYTIRHEERLVGLYTIEAEDPDQAIEAFQRATANGEIDFSDMDLVDSEDSIEEEK